MILTTHYSWIFLYQCKHYDVGPDQQIEHLLSAIKASKGLASERNLLAIPYKIEHLSQNISYQFLWDGHIIWLGTNFCLKLSSRTQKGDGASGSVPLFLEPRILLSYSQTEKDAIHDGFHL